MATSKSSTKRSLFKKPAWASTAPTKSADEDAPIFGQSHHYQEILQNERERRERHAAKQKVRAEKEKEKREAQERVTKRRRISTEAEDSDYEGGSDSRSARSGSVDSSQSQRSAEPIQEESSRVLRSTPKKKKNQLSEQPDLVQSPQGRSRRSQPDISQDVIALDDDEDTNAQVGQLQSSAKKPLKSLAKSRKRDSDPESEEEDEYLRELKAKARQEARSKKLGIGTSNSGSPDSPVKARTTDSHSPSTAQSNSHLDRATSTPVADDESEVQIYITTIIPNAKPVIVNRKISQPLDKVKEYWIRHNNLDPTIAAKVFFTWNNTQLYNSTTMRTIIERLKRTHPKPDGSDPSNGKIMIEAVTDEIFEYRKQQKMRRQVEESAAADNQNEANDRQNPDSANDNDAATGEDATPVPQPKSDGIVIKLKAQDVEDFSIRVRPNSTMRKILGAFCKIRKIDQDAHAQVWLSYDGDRLDEELTVDEVGFEHEDTVEVYFR